MFIVLDLLALIKRISHISLGVGTPLSGQLFINKIRYPKFYSTRTIIIFGENALCSSFKYFKILLTAKKHSCILQARICFFTLRLCFGLCLELVGQYASQQRSTNHTSRNHSCIFNKSAATQPVLLVFIIVIICHSIPSSKTINVICLSLPRLSKICIFLILRIYKALIMDRFGELMNEEFRPGTRDHRPFWDKVRS